MSDTQSDCPLLRLDQRFGRHVRQPHEQPQLRPVRFSGRRQCGAGQNGCVYPVNVPTLFNQLDAAGVSWKGYAQDLAPQPAARHSLRTALGPSSAAPPMPPPGRPGARHSPTRQRHRDRPVRAQALPVPMVRVHLQLRATAPQPTWPACSTRRTACMRPAERGDDPGVQLDHARQLQRCTRRGVRRQ